MTYEDRLQIKRYLVLGERRYRGHEQGTVFEARLDPDAERRAIERGAISLVGEVTLSAENYELPEDWPLSAADEPQAELLTSGSRVN